VYEAISVEDRDTPVVMLCDEGFVTDAQSAASSRGMPGARIVMLPDMTLRPAAEQVEGGVTPEVIDAIITALTKPLTGEEKSPTKEEEKPPRIVFKGDLEEVNRFFYKRGWTDGLPIIPPTEEAVAEMLTGTDLAPDHVVEKIIPRLGKATVEKIAINAVMAGALPTYMPLLIASVRVVMEPRAQFGTYEVSTGSWAPCLMVNGPIRNDLHINSGPGVMSPGDIANAAIGRAMGLIIKNIGGARKGIEDMGVIGNPMKYSLVIAENEEESPWEPLHVQEGFKKEDNTVTVFFPNRLMQMMAGMYPDDEVILRSIAYNIPPVMRGLLCLLLIPTHARILASKGWTKKDIAAFISEYARAPLSHHSEYYAGQRKTDSVSEEPVEMPGIGKQDKLRLNSLRDSPDESMSILRSPEWLRIIVAGGPSNFIGLLGGGVTTGFDRWVTKKVELPKDWYNLVNKYKDIVPTYVRY
jgi:hypothetical protein